MSRLVRVSLPEGQLCILLRVHTCLPASQRPALSPPPRWRQGQRFTSQVSTTLTYGWRLRKPRSFLRCAHYAPLKPTSWPLPSTAPPLSYPDSLVAPAPPLTPNRF